ncbi:MAG: hypothetical protein ACRDOF_08815, partial [Gaiellaceae bacterium]
MGEPVAAPADRTDDLAAPVAPAQPAEPDEAEPEAETVPFAAALAFDEPLADFILPPVAAIAQGTPSSR